jgi:ABC-type Fe2+-enterobactin transport system substrate-binding protein
MDKKVSVEQIAGLKAHAEQKNKDTIRKVNKAIDRLKRTNQPVNFETVAKLAGVARATLYNNPLLKERILSLRELSKTNLSTEASATKKNKMQLQEEKITALREKLKQLERDKSKLIEQLIELHELKEENNRLKEQLNRKK